MEVHFFRKPLHVGQVGLNRKNFRVQILQFGRQLLDDEFGIVHFVSHLIDGPGLQQELQISILSSASRRCRIAVQILFQKFHKIRKDAATAAGTATTVPGRGSRGTGHEIGENGAKGIAAGIVLGIVVVVLGHEIVPTRTALIVWVGIGRRVSRLASMRGRPSTRSGRTTPATSTTTHAATTAALARQAFVGGIDFGKLIGRGAFFRFCTGLITDHVGVIF